MLLYDVGILSVYLFSVYFERKLGDFGVGCCRMGMYSGFIVGWENV